MNRISKSETAHQGPSSSTPVPLLFRTLYLSTFLTMALAGCGELTKGKPAAEKAISQFHQTYNQGKLEVIWKEADARFRTASTKENYDAFMGAIQRKLGKVTSTSNVGWNVKSFNLKTTVYMTQNPMFEHGQGTESFTFGIDGTNATLLGYNIQSMDLITK
jgi:hypothetical protein